MMLILFILFVFCSPWGPEITGRPTYSLFLCFYPGDGRGPPPYRIQALNLLGIPAFLQIYRPIYYCCTTLTWETLPRPNPNLILAVLGLHAAAFLSSSWPVWSSCGALHLPNWLGICPFSLQARLGSASQPSRGHGS